MKRLAASSLAVVGAIVALLVLLGNAWSSYLSIRALGDAEARVQFTLDVNTRAHSVLSAATDATARQRAYLVTGDDTFLTAAGVHAELDSRIAGLAQLAPLSVAKSMSTQSIDRLDTAIAELDGALDAGLDVRQRQGIAAIIATPELIRRTREPLDRVRAGIAAIEAEEIELRDSRAIEVTRLRHRAAVTIAIATAVAIATVLTSYALVVRDERRQSRFSREQARLANHNRLLIESTGEGIYGVDLQGKCTFLNVAGERMLGLKTADVIGKPMHAISHHTKPDGSPYPSAECPIYRSFTDGVGCRVDSEKFFRADGSSFPVEYSAYPIRDGGSVSGAVVTFSDITQRKEQEQSLVEASERVAALANNISQLAWMAEPQGQIFWFNQRWYEYTGQSIDEALSVDGWRYVHHPDHLEAAARKYARAVAEGSEWEDTFPLRGKDGEYRWFLSRAIPIRDASGRITRWFGTNTDVTKQRETEAALLEGRERLQLARNEAEAAREQAEQANVAKSQFLANMSHELRTPLNAVIMYSELLQEEAEDRKLDGFIPDLDKIRNAGRHLLALVNGVLDLSKIEAGKMDLYLETFDAARMLEDVATTVQPLVMKKNNKLILDTAPEVKEMHADLTKVRQVLFNLLSNASKFTENGTVRVETRHEPGQLVGAPGWIVFKVVDSGIGMTPEQLSRLFQPFVQADASTTRKYGGTGLGLAISKRFVEMMGGSITADSVPDTGTTFLVRLPSLVLKQAAEEPNAPGTGGAIQHPATAGQQTVLVIDDEASVREVVSRALAADGMRVVTAADGEAGLKLARQVKPDLIILDVMMPKMDGWAVLTAVKADPELTNTPVIMLTMVHDADMGYVLGASEYLTKPVDREKLASVIAKYRTEGDDNEVLIVEDDDATREVIRRSLLRDGWSVSEVPNGRVALERLAVHKPALILLDLIMPEMDGFEFLVELRKTPEWRDLPVCVLTSKDLSADEQAWLTGKVERIVQKGAYTRDQLMSEVKKITQQHAHHHGIGQSTHAAPGAEAATMARVKQEAAERVEKSDAGA